MKEERKDRRKEGKENKKLLHTSLRLNVIKRETVQKGKFRNHTCT